jgi:hypothetical protein
MMLGGIGHEEKLEQMTPKIPQAKINFANSMVMLYKELILAKNI